MRNSVLIIAAGLLLTGEVGFFSPAAGALGTAPPAAVTPAPTAAGRGVEVGVASWNIELFDEAGPGDKSFPTRSRRHLEMIAETILGTGGDVIGLQEVIGGRSLAQLISELNRMEKKKGRRERRTAVWRGVAGKTRPEQIHSAILWNETSLELIGEVTELEDLSWGHRKGERVASSDLLRFHRIPLAARFRVRAAPACDFTVIVIHLKSMDQGIDGHLDSNDRRRRGEMEDLLRWWVLKPGTQGRLADEDMIVLGDMNERSSFLIQLLDKYGTADDVRGRFILEPSGFSDPRALFLFTDGLLRFPEYYTYQGSIEKGEGWGAYSDGEAALTEYKNFLDHILISRSLADNWDGDYTIDYFESRYTLDDHVHLSDHRPVSIRLRFPPPHLDPLPLKGERRKRQ
ncbi:MAG: hypothetical protein P9M00_05885 [Candidatus Tritonobacter lacicola]|nr:hypothetical protein [Candidatus Tritonobacter lacicola]